MAVGDNAERIGPAWPLQSERYQAVTDCADELRMVRVGRSVDQQRPIRVAVLGDFRAPDRAIHDDGSIFGGEVFQHA